MPIMPLLDDNENRYKRIPLYLTECYSVVLPLSKYTQNVSVPINNRH
jgi:hypothetical protein